jgi:hypothetical protein
MKPLSAQIKANRVEAQADQALVTIDLQINDDDPCGKEWPKDEDKGWWGCSRSSLWSER